MSGNRYPTPEEKEDFVLDLKYFLEHNFDEEKSDREQSEKFYKGFKGFMKRKPNGEPEGELGRSLDLEVIKRWLKDLNENLIAQTPSTPEPVWALNTDYNEIYIKDWKPGQIPSASPGFLGHPRKSKKQRKSRKNTRKSRKNTRNNRKRRT